MEGNLKQIHDHVPCVRCLGWWMDLEWMGPWRFFTTGGLWVTSDSIAFPRVDASGSKIVVKQNSNVTETEELFIIYNVLYYNVYISPSSTTPASATSSPHAGKR